MRRPFALAACVLLLGLLPACQLSPFIVLTRNNADIPEDVRQAVHAVHDPFIEAAVAGDREEAIRRMGALFEGQDASAADEMLRILANGPVVWNEHYSEIKGGDSAPKAVMPGEGIEYTFLIEPVAEKVTVIYSTVAHPATEYLLYNAYALQDGAWQMVACMTVPLRCNGMDAAGLLAEAQRLHEQGWDVPAALTAQASAQVLAPANLTFTNHQEVEKGIRALGESLVIPEMPLIEVDGNPVQVYSVTLQVTDGEGLSPVIHYVTGTALHNEAEIEAEADGVAWQLGEHFPGLHETYDYILCKAYNETPGDPTQWYDTYTTVIDHY